MRICLSCYRGNPYCGGQGIYLYHLSRELTRQGHEVALVVGPPYPEPMPWARVIPIPNHHFWGKKVDFLPKDDPLCIFSPLNFFEFAASRIGYFPEILAFSLRAFVAIRRLHAEARFDVIHDVETLGYGLLLARRMGLPVVSTVHHPLSRDMAAHLSKARSWVERYYNVVFFPLIMQGMVARRIDGLITSSVAGREELIGTFRLRPEMVRLVYTGVDLETFDVAPNLERNPREILFVGNAQDPRKGIKVLLEALCYLPPSVKLTIVDEGEPSKGYAPGLVRSMGLGSRVTFTGRIPLPELVERYRRTTALVLPSLFEGFGLPVAEAMACGTPVVAARAGSLPEVVGEDEQGGMLVPPGDAKALAESIHKIMSRPALAKELGAKARARVEALFSWERTARETTEVYRWAAQRGVAR